MSIRLFKDTRSPSLTDTIRVNGAAFDLTGSTVKLRMRPVGSSTLKVDANATVVSAEGGTVRYDWGASDLDTAGDYLAWWRVTTGGLVQETEEFALEVLAHAPGAGLLCTVADVRSYLDLPPGDRGADALIEQLIGRATRSISSYANREFVVEGSNPKTRTFEVGPWARGRIVPVGDMAAMPDEVRILDAAGDLVADVDVAALQGYPLNRESWQPITRLRFRPAAPTLSPEHQLEVEGDFGFPAVPADVAHATVVTVGIWVRREVSAYSASFNVDEARLERPEALPSAVRAMLVPYRFPVVA